MAFFPRRRLKNVLKVAKEFNPDIIHCQGGDIARLAFIIGKHLRIPVIVHVEIASGIVSEKFVGSRKMRPIRLLTGLPIRGPAFWSWLCKRADALITSNPSDAQILNLLSEYGKPVYYLPWPANIPEGCKLDSKRDRKRGIYAGLLVPFKNTQEFEWILPIILQKTPTKEFVIIGTGAHSVIIQKLQQQFGDAIKYIPSLPRCEVIRMISGSYYGITPVKKGGWGFIGDCWATETPLLMLKNVFVSKELGSCVAGNAEELVEKINRLYEDSLYYQQLQKIGYEAYSKRTSDAVGNELYAILSRTLKNTCI
jgi:glycosyltransferase involved in cell wall biosynthesis